MEFELLQPHHHIVLVHHSFHLCIYSELKNKTINKNILISATTKQKKIK